MPPVVDGEKIIGRPVLDTAFEPPFALIEIVRHLVDVSDCMDGPRVASVALHRCRSRLRGACIVSHFLESECMHSSVVLFESRTFLDRWEASSDAIAKF